MLDNCQSARERWGGVSEIIDRWLKERQDMLVLFCKISAQKSVPFSEETEITLRHFCQILVDYVSAGHFEVYEQLVNEGHEYDDQEGLSVAKVQYKAIDTTTEFILDFNDKYQETDDLGALLQDLSKLGESLATRFEAEDKMIEVLHNSHRDQIA
jgi:regulator of sigma D